MPHSSYVPTEPTRVLIACDHMDYGGALHGGGRQLIELARALEERADVEATFCVLREPSALGRALVAEGLPLTFLGDKPWNPGTLWHFVRLIRERRIDVLHLTDYGASTFGRLAGLLTGRPSIVQIIAHHSSYQRRGFPLHVELAYRALAPLTARALAISGSVREFAASHMGFRHDVLEVLPYPLPQHSVSAPSPERVAALRAQYGIAPGDPVIGAVTRFYPSKGMAYLVQAFAQVLAVRPDAWLLLVGQGPEEEALRAQCRALGIERRVIFAGFQREIADHVGLQRVAAVPSLEEGFGLSALESLALGVPVVASEVGGLPDVVRDGVTGLLVPPANATALAEALLRVLSNDVLHARLADAARQDAERFSLDRYVGRLVQLYHGLRLRRRGDRAPVMRIEGREDGAHEGARPRIARLTQH